MAKEVEEEAPPEAPVIEEGTTEES